jgi:FOG: EAL domain
VAAALEGSGLDPGCLVLELTESVLMDDPDRAAATLNELKQLGVRLAIDDFGTGYSSLAYLQRFPIDILKIDRSFVARVLGGPEDAALAHAIIKLGQTLHLDVVAEGIETDGQLNELRKLGCEYGQGYLFARPLAPDGLTSLLREPPDEVSP